MRIKFSSIMYEYDAAADKCTVTTPLGVEEYENPYEGYNVFISHLNFLTFQRLRGEAEKNSRNRWTGMKEENK